MTARRDDPGRHGVDSRPVVASVTSLARRGLQFLTVGRLLAWRATSPVSRNRPFVVWDDETYTYADAHREALRFARLMTRLRRDAVRRCELAPGAPLAFGIYQDNSPAFVFAILGAALTGDLVFGLNTGFRGDTLAAVLDRGEVRAVLTAPDHLEQLERVLDGRPNLRRDAILVDGEAPPGMHRLDAALATDGDPASGGPEHRADGNAPLVVIYTSGTTGVPKGIGCSHLKLLGAGALTRIRIGLRSSDRGYLCMPLYHSNAWLLGIMPLLHVGGSFVLKRRFSASAFEEDMLAHGVTYMNYVGQPLHYILSALEAKHGDSNAVERSLARHPKNRFRIAHGNGASAVDRAKLIRYLGMEHVYELYGSTEAVISTVLQPGDPPDSVGRLRSNRVCILDEDGRECPPAVVDAQGRIANYDQAVGEIAARIDSDNLFFDGYFRDADASQRKYRDGYYRSGDLGHIRIVDGKRYLYFDGRTDDWIRKDGENFSAESVVRYAAAHAGVELAAAYGVPSDVSDEKVMVALQLREGARFDPRAAFERFLEQQRDEGMDPKWMPDYVRIVPEMPMSTTQKVLVRELKRQGFDIAAHPEMVVWLRERGDESYRRMTPAMFESIRKRFEDNGRERLLRP